MIGNQDKFKVGPHTLALTLESVLMGHENRVTSVQWGKSPSTGTGSQSSNLNLGQGKLTLLSSSIDKSIISWEQDEDSGIWIESVHVGEVGGNRLGFYGAQYSPTYDRIIANVRAIFRQNFRLDKVVIFVGR